MAFFRYIVIYLSIIIMSGRAIGAPISPDRAFETMRTLVGDWEAKTAKGSVISVNYRLISADSVLVQTFRTSSGRQTLTLFHMDGSSLMATHYCAQGNQPRLRLERTSTDRSLTFLFFDATNLPNAKASHLRRLQFDLVDAHHLNEIETYRNDGKDESNTLKFIRVPKP